jgi:predicted ATPase/class 3 adenylate cyclase/GAF domain-containing protein/tRNA A-37 threonylcarbamoyl transferase component Bud32
MINLPNYHIIEQIYKSSSSVIYRARRLADEQIVILKALQEDYPSAEKIAHYKQEYEILRHLQDIDGVVRVFEQIILPNNIITVFEHFPGQTLKKLMLTPALNRKGVDGIIDFLELGIKICQILAEIHAANVIHKDLNPHNILLNLQNKQICIIDFGISNLLSRENPSLKNMNQLEGTLAYLSPEQTGRMNRTLDYRTDFYSLGATFYEILTHRFPFDSEDAIELIHCHLAKYPIEPQILNPNIPAAISAIIMKMLEKTAEHRYQSAWGIKADLESCKQQLEQIGIIDPNFIPAQQDISYRLQFPQKLYGRDYEIQTLLTIFDNLLLGPSQFLLVKAQAGLGKSALVQELYKPVTAKRGYFISGKFDQFQRNIPYSAIVVAFRHLIQQLLTESEESVGNWRNKLTLALGEYAQIMLDIIPELKLIITPKHHHVLPDAQTRFQQVFKRFVQVFCHVNHPLVIFLDDLHWADNASLDLITTLLYDSNYLFLLGAYRESEVTPNHPLMLCVYELEQHGVELHEISLSPLQAEHVNDFIADTLNTPANLTHDLTSLIMQKTLGNPFFVNEFLKNIYNDKILDFNWQFFAWQWDAAKILACDITENVISALTKKLAQLPTELQQILQRAACIGNQFQLHTLALVCEDQFDNLLQQLNTAIQEGVLIQSLHSEDVGLSEFAFVHDRVQKAVYLMIPPEYKQITHWQVGQLLLENIAAELREQYIFTIIDQLNIGIDPKDYFPMLPLFDLDIFASQVYLAELNYSAGKKAKDSAAYNSAFDYFYIAIHLLTKERWQSHYQLVLQIYEQAIDTAYLSGYFDHVDELSAVVFLQAHDLLDKINSCEIKIQADIARDQLNPAIDTALAMLAALGEKFPTKPKIWHLVHYYSFTNKFAHVLNPDNIVNLPIMVNKHKQAAMRIMARISLVLYMVKPKLFKLLAMRIITLTIRYGISQESPVAYAIYGQFLSSSGHNLDLAYQFGRSGLLLLDKYPRFTTLTMLIFNVWLLHGKQHLKHSAKPLLNAYQTGLEYAELEFASRAILNYCAQSLALGTELEKLQQEIQNYAEIIQQLGQQVIGKRLALFKQVVINLMTEDADFTLLLGPDYDEKQILIYLTAIQDNNSICWLYFYKMLLCYLARDIELAMQYAQQVRLHLTGLSATTFEPQFYFYDSLIKIALAETMTKAKKRLFLRQVRDNQRKLKLWQQAAPSNYLHKYYLVKAEYCRLLGQIATAMEYYHQAIQLAQENNYIHEVALANELAAEFFFNLSLTKIAQVYIREAHYNYQKWGAKAKVLELESRYVHLIHQATSQPGRDNKRDHKIDTTIHATLHSDTNANLNFDLDSVLKASQAITSEIVLDNLLKNLMTIVIENAGAERGVLLLNDNGILTLVAEATTAQAPVLLAVPLIDADLPKTLLNFVARVQENVVLHHACKEGSYTRDNYIMQHESQSILCLPLLHQRKLIGILYLENQLIPHAFTPQRLELLNMLSAQITISIENARLYTNMTSLNQAYERFIPREFLSLLDKKSVTDVVLGDQIEKEMSVLFSDIRDFTSISEAMPPQENFDFINAYLSRMEPNILAYNGFIDKYIGDAIMALFPTNADDALQAAIDMLITLNEYNKTRGRPGRPIIKIGIGIHTGRLMLGTVGGKNRMDGTVISDAVNLASRIEGLTKIYGSALLITEFTYNKLSDPLQYHIRMIDKVYVKGKTQQITVYEVFDADARHLLELKKVTADIFECGLVHYHNNKLSLALECFVQVCFENPEDQVARVYIERCHATMQ